MTATSYEIKVENIFEGPMDLLVHLIKKNEVDIYDIPISLITDQFLAYLEWMRSLSIEFASDFLVMAATLAHIKSRMLLPSSPSESDDENPEDPRMEIAGPLIELFQMKSVAEQLIDRPILNEDIFSRPPEKTMFLYNPDEEVIKTDLFDLIQAYHQLLQRTAGQIGMRIISEKISVKEKMTEIINTLEEKGTITFRELISEHPTKIEIIVTFLAILEIAKLNLARIVQSSKVGIMRLFYK
jgi:segregation and condensation protein A